MRQPIKLFIFFGMIASGKSTLAQAWAANIKAPYYNSDRVRKELAGLTATAPQQESFNAGIYTPEFSRKTYEAMLDRAGPDLTQQKRVVLDGSYQSKAERVRVKELATAQGVNFSFIYCSCPENVVKERLKIRARDKKAVSDGRWEIYVKQKGRFEMPAELSGDELLTINTDAPINKLVTTLENML